MTAAPPVSPRLIVILAFALLLAAFDFVYRPFLPLDPGFVGHDYGLAMSAWLDGDFWFRSNGLAAPWFTPSFCAGQPFFADPQSGYYSLPQVLSFAFSPLGTAHLTLVIGASLLFWGGYLLMRSVFETGTIVAILVGGLLMFNGFLPHRLLIGHIGYHGFALVPWLALLLLMPVRNVGNSLAAAVAAAVLLAYWVHCGFGTLMLAAGLAVLLLASIYGLRGGPLKPFMARGAIAAVVGLALSASKLTAAAAFMANFPRTNYLLPGLTSLPDAVTAIAGALFLPSQWAFAVGTPRMTNVQWGLGPHEWAFNFGFAAALLGLVVFAAHIVRGRALWTAGCRRPLLLAVLMLGLLWPLAFNLWDPQWNAFLKTVPILKSTSTPLRWISVYIPTVAVAIGLLLADTGWRWTGGLAVACLVATVAQSALEPREFYLAQHYDVRALQIADAMARAGRIAPGIHSLGRTADFNAGKYQTQLTSNETFIAGVSQIYCYNPIFGYRLENFSAAGLEPGPVLLERDGLLNLKNPACYVFPEENNCRPGDRFRADQVAEATDFVSYRPFAFHISRRQVIANWITELALCGIAIGAIFWLIRVWQSAKPGTRMHS